MSGALQGVFMNQRSFGTPPGQNAYTTAGSYSFVVPAGVTSISAVVVGGGGGGTNGSGGCVISASAGSGGGLAYKNGVSVTPGETLTVVVGAGGTANTTSVCASRGGSSKVSRSATALVEASGGAISATLGALVVGDGGGSGGEGPVYTGTVVGSGGGGAGGYAGNGGNGRAGSPATAGSGGGGGGGGIGNESCNCTSYFWGGGAGGGGTGLLGQGSNGAAGNFGTGGGGGSGGNSGSASGITSGGAGGLYGGGGGRGGWSENLCTGNQFPQQGGAGAVGAVRIIWGAGRSFPSTNTGNL